MKKPAIIIFFLFALSSMTEARAADVRVTATLEPEEVSLGKASRLTLAVEGTVRVFKPELPQVPDLEIRYIGNTTNYQSDGLRTIVGLNLLYSVVPRKTGVFTIPEISVRTEAGMLTTTPVTLRVAQPNASPQPPAARRSRQASSSPQDAGEVGAEIAAIKLEVPKRDFYVGEQVPAELKVYLHGGLNLSEVSMPTLSGTAFTVGKLSDKPEQAIEPINGVQYRVLTWNTVVAPIKSGEHPLGAQIECLIKVQDRSGRSLDDIFDDPFFNRFFPAYQEKKVTLKTKDTQAKILPLPSEGRPADFSGAIGQFEITANAAPTEVAAGDPVTLKVIVAGAGNFDRVKAPEIGKNLGFRTYSPSSKFEPFDSIGLGGRKVFEAMVIPQNASVKSIPRIPFTYFNPDEGKYVSIATDEIPLKVTGTAAAAAPSVSSASGVTPPAPPAGFTASDAEVVPNQLIRGRSTSTLEPVFFQPWFWAIQAFGLAALIGAGIYFRRRDRLETDPAFARSVSASKAVQAQLDLLDKALREGNSHDFFIAARRVLQERLGERLSLKPETITPADLADWSERVNHGANDSLVESIREVQKIFEVADAVAYSGQKYGADSLEGWKAKVLSALQRLGRTR